MRILFILALGLQSAAQPRQTMSALMIDPIYPASDAIFYITTRTPSTDAEWRTLETKTAALAQAASALATPMYFRDRARWMTDAQLLIDASTTALAAVRQRDVTALEHLNEPLYTACVQCHQDYRPNYGRRTSAAPGASANVSSAAEPPAEPAGALSRVTADAQGGTGQTAKGPSGTAAPGTRASNAGSTAGSDLDGVWNFSTLTPLERPAEFEGRGTMTDAEAKAYETRVMAQNDRDRRPDSPEADVGGAYNEFWWDRGSHVATVNGRHQTSLVVEPGDGRIPPATAAAREKAAARAADRGQHPADGPEDRSLGERCLVFNAGPPMMAGPYNNYVQIFTNRDSIVIYNEMIHDARVIPIDRDGRGTHEPSAIRKWQGDSRAHWEGGTLVVDTTNFTDKTSFRGTDQNLHLVERFTRADGDTLRYEFTIDDPTAFTRPWTVSLPMVKTNDRVFEYACHEGNYALGDILRGARRQEQLKDQR